jgi:hypothetical protein
MLAMLAWLAMLKNHSNKFYLNVKDSSISITMGPNCLAGAGLVEKTRG